jgi:formylglycine-generating enzyme required for sulfatase activity
MQMQHHHLPQYLKDRGFVADNAGGVEFIIPPLCAVAAGSFLMGTQAGCDPEAKDTEFPQHQVTLGGCSIGMYQVTVAEYGCAVRVGAVREPPLGEWLPIEWPAQLLRPEHPAVCVSWPDALAYAAWLADVSGRPWRLATEAEWEKAARGADGRTYPWGDMWDATRANTNDGGPGRTTPVGSYPDGVSPCGAYDLAGNVWEWTSSLLQPYAYVAGDGRERLDAERFRVLRGGSWNYPAQGARTARRGNADPSSVRGSFGFRLVLPE